MGAETEFLAVRGAIGVLVAERGDDISFNEAQTEDEVIVPVLAALGWTDFIRQATTSQSGRQDVPDFLLFASTEAKRAARSERNDSRRYRHGHVVGEAKRWGRPPDRGDGRNQLATGTPPVHNQRTDEGRVGQGWSRKGRPRGG